MIKRLGTLCLVVSMFMGSSIAYADETVYVNLSNATERAIENDANIRGIESSIPAIEEGLRKAKEGSNRLSELFDTYKKYKSMYYDSEDRYDKFIEMDSAELTQESIDLNKRLAVNTSASKVERLLEDLTFISYYQLFNMEEPNLTQEEVYVKYVRTIETAETQAQNEYDKALNNIDLIKGNITVGVNAVYIGILDLDAAIGVQSESLDLRKKITSELEVMYGEGLISEFDLYKNNIELEKLKVEVRKLEIQKENLLLSLKKMLGMEVDDLLIVTKNTGIRYFKEGTSLATYADQASSNSPSIKALKLDSTYYNNDFDSYLEYGGKEFGAEYENLKLNVDKYNSDLRDAEWMLDSNVNYAYGDIISKSEMVEMYTIDLQNAYIKLNQGLQQKELGLIKQTDLHGLELGVQGSKLSLNQAERAYASALLKFDMLIDYGIEYK